MVASYHGAVLIFKSVYKLHWSRKSYPFSWPNQIPPAQTLSKWGKRVRGYNRDHGTAKLWVATVMPGYDDRKVRPANGFARSRDGGAYYRQNWKAAIDSKPNWVVVNSFNAGSEREATTHGMFAVLSAGGTVPGSLPKMTD